MRRLLPEEKPAPGQRRRQSLGAGEDPGGQEWEHAGSKLEGKAFAFSLCPPKAWRDTAASFWKWNVAQEETQEPIVLPVSC